MAEMTQAVICRFSFSRIKPVKATKGEPCEPSYADEKTKIVWGDTSVKDLLEYGADLAPDGFKVDRLHIELED